MKTPTPPKRPSPGPRGRETIDIAEDMLEEADAPDEGDVYYDLEGNRVKPPRR